MDQLQGAAALAFWRDVAADVSALRGDAPDAVGSTTAAPTPMVMPSPKQLCDLMAIRELPSAGSTSVGDASRRPKTVFAVASQESSTAGATSSHVVVRVAKLPEDASITLRIEVPGYSITKHGPFRQLLVSASSHGLLLLAPHCCAAVALPHLNDGVSNVELRAVPLAPHGDALFVKVQWHPLSDAHIGVLLSDSTFQLLNLSHRASVVDPEVYLSVTFGGNTETGESVADFAFGPQWASIAGPASHSEAAWLAMAVLFLSTRGRISVYNPVLPAFAVLPRALLDSVHTFGSVGGACGTWLAKTLLCSANHEPIVPQYDAVQHNTMQQNGCVGMRHSMHLHGQAAEYYRLWRPIEQPLAEERVEGELLSPRSPRHHRSKYCSLQLVACSPIPIIARATETGLVEILLVSGTLGPRFDGFDDEADGNPLACAVFEEVDLVVGHSRVPTIRLSAPTAAESRAVGANSTASNASAAVPMFFARTRTLVAAIEIPWIDVMVRGLSTPADGLPPTTVTTLVEVRGADGPCEIMGWQLLTSSAADGTSSGCGGLWLRVKDKTPSGQQKLADTVVVQSVDIQAVLQSASKARAGKPIASDNAGSRGTQWRSLGIAPTTAGTGATAVQHPDRDEYLKPLTMAMPWPSPLFDSAVSNESGEQPTASAVAKAVSTVQGGQLADLAARQSILGHLCSQLPKRAAAMKSKLAKLKQTEGELKDRTEETKRKAEVVQRRQKELEVQHAGLLESLRTETELRALGGLAASELPRLWALLHELRQAFELLRAAAAAPDRASDTARLEAKQLVTIEQLQRSWTDTTTTQLRSHVEQLEEAVAAAEAATPPTWASSGC